MKAFLRNTSLRDSCYNCKFKKTNRVSDITLADYWGVKKYHPKLFDNKGTSAVILNSDKGRKLFDLIKNQCTYEKTSLDFIVDNNPSFNSSAPMDKNRKAFFDNIDNVDFDILVKKYTYHQNIVMRGIKKIQRTIKKLYK